MLSRAALFSEKCEQAFDLGGGSRNTVLFSEHDRFVGMAGLVILLVLPSSRMKKMKVVVITSSRCTISVNVPFGFLIYSYNKYCTLLYYGPLSKCLLRKAVHFKLPILPNRKNIQGFQIQADYIAIG